MLICNQQVVGSSPTAGSILFACKSTLFLMKKPCLVSSGISTRRTHKYRSSAESTLFWTTLDKFWTTEKAAIRTGIVDLSAVR